MVHRICIYTFECISRFLYHFSGVRQTNRLDKPEWFFTQILNWARDNHIFVGTHIQPALNLAGHSDINIRVIACPLK